MRNEAVSCPPCWSFVWFVLDDMDRLMAWQAASWLHCLAHTPAKSADALVIRILVHHAGKCYLSETAHLVSRLSCSIGIILQGWHTCLSVWGDAILTLWKEKTGGKIIRMLNNIFNVQHKVDQSLCNMHDGCSHCMQTQDLKILSHIMLFSPESQHQICVHSLQRNPQHEQDMLFFCRHEWWDMHIGWSSPWGWCNVSQHECYTFENLQEWVSELLAATIFPAGSSTSCSKERSLSLSFAPTLLHFRTFRQQRPCFIQLNDIDTWDRLNASMLLPPFSLQCHDHSPSQHPASNPTANGDESSIDAISITCSKHLEQHVMSCNRVNVSTLSGRFIFGYLAT